MDDTDENTPAPIERSLTLDDGRVVAYSVFGDPDGVPVLSTHGGLVSRNDVAPAHATAAELGVAVISPDRPGVGGSSRCAGQSLLDWARTDVVAVLDDAGVDRFAVMGWSEGGQYALAVAHALADRVWRAAVIAGCPPLDDPDRFAELNRLDHRLSTWARERPKLAHRYFGFTHLVATRAPHRAAAMMARSAGGKAHDAVVAEGGWAGQILAEATHDTAGATDGYLALVAPWGFTPAQVPVPVDLHQGTADALVPVAWAELLEAQLPESTLTTYPDEDHMIALTRRRDVLEGLLAHAPRTA